MSGLDWAGLAFNGLWVLGAAMVLAAFSFCCYEAQRRGQRLRMRLGAPGFQLWLSVGLMLVGVGAALLGPRWWERVLWGVFGVMNMWQLVIAWREWRTGGD